MPIFLKEANQELKDNMYEIPKELHKHLVSTLKQYGDGNEQSKGYKRLNALINPKYNKRSNKEESQFKDGKHISHTDMEQIDHDFRHMSSNPNNIQRILNGGDEMAMWVKNELNRERTKVEPISKQKKVETRNKNSIKPISNPTKPISLGNTIATVHENKIFEQADLDHPYWEKLSEYNAYYIFNAFENKENIWNPLINPKMYEKALQEFTKYGKFIHFPTKYLYQWMGIIMKNTAILREMTNICGHGYYTPVDDFVGYYFEDDYDKWEEYKNNIGESYDWAAMWEFLDEMGFDKWSVLPDGSDAVSDFGLEPLEKLILKYNTEISPEELIVLINKLLDVVHCRGDLASMFITGGSRALSQISEETQNKKSIYLTQKQLNVLKEYRDQLTIPFDGIDGKYNYQHFIDWLESIGKYGKLPKSDSNIQKLMSDSFNESLELFSEDYDLELNEFIEYLNDNNISLFELVNLPEEECEEYIKDNDFYISNYFNDNGKIEFDNFKCEKFQDALYDNAFDHNNFRTNDRNLLFIERFIEIPKSLDKTFNTYNKKHNDLFLYLTNEYGNNIGQYWSWFEGGVQCGSPYYSKTDKIILRGYVDPKNVDWEETIYRNAYSCKEEREIYLPYNTPIEIFEILTKDGKKLPLNGSIIVNA